jgi:hypothetical protein
VNFDFDSMIGALGAYIAVISALALGVERVMDLIKVFAKKHLVASYPKEKMTEEEKKERYYEEDKRQRIVRLWAIILGIFLAFICKVDTFEILKMPSPVLFGIPIFGYLLSGLAASKGSTFLHDALEIVRGVRDVQSATIDAQLKDKQAAAGGQTINGG